ncbi:hypothetical protein LWI29_026174 [Acer saccharum]|uniref:RNase H type-1 domain-containing protein n=1 Tax=Acer saccharum TaxID=4024 RepID=A0AA39RR60_ACESA|nr:hypothetical protein LWI29_026174 [Acer saccharum]
MGSRWRIGRGNSVHVYSDRWIPRPTTFKVISPMKLNERVTVDSLKLASGHWNVDLLKENFLPDDVDMILSLPPVAPSVDDALLWHFESDGNYSVRSGYRVGCVMSAPPGSSSLDESTSWWKALWRFRIPPKIKIFLWRACHHWLPTMLFLAKRGVPSDGLCPRCHKRLESIIHAIWGCRDLGSVRRNCVFLHGLVITDDMHFHDLMLLILNSIKISEVELLCVIFWRVWFYRNQLIHKLDGQDLGEVVNWASNFLEEWQSYQMVTPSTKVNVVEQIPKWQPPLAGYWKINTDAASCYRNRIIGLGIVVRDVFGTVKLACARKLEAMFSPLVAEALAVLDGIHLAVDAGLVPFQIDTDSLIVVNLVNKGDSSSADVGHIIADIVRFLRSLESCSIAFTPRKRNAVAHSLARTALSIASDRCWVDSCPPCVERLVLLDSSV